MISRSDSPARANPSTTAAIFMSFMTLLKSTSNTGRALITRLIQSVVLETGELICISDSYVEMGDDNTCIRYLNTAPRFAKLLEICRDVWQLV
jgi:hypothetical protein